MSREKPLTTLSALQHGGGWNSAIAVGGVLDLDMQASQVVVIQAENVVETAVNLCYSPVPVSSTIYLSSC